MDKSVRLAEALLRGIGGSANILRLENCMTRVRVEVSDDSLLHPDDLRQLDGIKGTLSREASISLLSGPVRLQKSRMRCTH